MIVKMTDQEEKSLCEKITLEMHEEAARLLEKKPRKFPHPRSRWQQSSAGSGDV